MSKVGDTTHVALQPVLVRRSVGRRHLGLDEENMEMYFRHFAAWQEKKMA
jgi:hypothetical protein